MKKIILVLVTLICTMFPTCAQNVYLPFDYNFTHSEKQVFSTAYNGEIYVAVGESGMVWVSEDYDEWESWEMVKHAAFSRLYEVKWENNQFTAIGDGFKIVSNDGYNWQKIIDFSCSDLNYLGIKPVQDIVMMTRNGENPGSLPISTTFEPLPERLAYTGDEFFKVEIPLGTDIYKIYKSVDLENWEHIKDTIYEKSIIGEKTQIINTGTCYLVRNTALDNGKSPNSVNLFTITMYDFDLNFIRHISFKDYDAYIVKMSYINNTCYVTLSNTNTYKSTDLENWELVAENIGVPISTGNATIYKTCIDNGLKPSLTGTYYERPILYENGLPTKNVVEEGIEQCGTIALGDFFISFDNYVLDTEEYEESTGVINDWSLSNNKYKTSFSFSKDGIYWATQVLPKTEFKIESFEITNDSLIIKLRYMCYKFLLSDMEAVVPQSDVYIEVNNEILGFDTPPVMENDRLLVPIRFLTQQLGAEVEWNQATETATIVQDNKTVNLKINSTTAIVNNQEKVLDTVPKIVNGRTMIPLRFLSEELGYTVEWDGETNTAVISAQ